MLLKALPSPALSLNPQGCVSWWNPAAEALLGADLDGRHVRDLAWDEDGEPASFPAGGSCEWTLREAMSWRVVEVRVGSCEDGGRFLLLRDVTERRKEEELVEDQKDVLEALGCGRPLTEVLDRIAEMVHYAHPGALCAFLDFDESGEILRLRAAPGLDASEREALEYGTAGPKWLRVPIHATGGTTPGLMALRLDQDEAPLEDVLNAAVQLSGMAIAARRAEETLLHAQKLESLGVLAGGIAHDFNNLLAAALGNLELVREQVGVASPLNPYLSRVERSTRRAADLTRQLLAYSGRGDLAIRPVDLVALVKDTCELLHGTLSSRITLVQDLGAKVPRVLADEAQLQQVVMNLAINAAEAIGDGHGMIRVGLQAMALREEQLDRSFPGQALRPGEYVELRIDDDGCGMDEVTRSRIFDPFFTTKFTGRGLGLAATASVIRTLRGGIHIVSEPGVGTSFRVLLSATTAQPSAPEARVRARLFGSGRVLVVDDEQDVRQLVTTVLARAGFDVVQAADGVDAVQRYADEGPFRLVVMDLTMPRMGGGEALDRIRDIDPGVPCLLASGYPEAASPPGDAHTRFIQKPFRLARLTSAVAALLSGEE
ncbi:MAG TPA: response regulator [Myxococcota bacterium]|nr:response regulator [Myxococcota bacterium]